MLSLLAFGDVWGGRGGGWEGGWVGGRRRVKERREGWRKVDASLAMLKSF